MEKLFYSDCHLSVFTAAVTGCEPQGSGYAVTLDATAFYPEGGGQACDLGTIGGVNVLDVQERDGQILHFCDGKLEVGATVTGRIDWTRRFDLMQQHTGEHIVSGLIHEKFGWHNVGFHVGADVMEVDFDGPIAPEDLAQIELRANEAVWADLPVECRVPGPEELQNLTYRTKRALPWPVRIVRVPGYDSCACCGVHVARTGEIGLIKILSCVKLRGGVRLELVCGGRAYRYLARIFEENRRVSQAFSVPMDTTAEAALRMNEALAAEKLRAAGLQSRIFDSISESYVNRNNVVHFEEGLEPLQVRLLADRIAGSVTGHCAVFSGRDGNYSYCLASRQEDLRQLNKDLTTRLNGKGGGKPNFQQGSLRADREAIERFLADGNC